MQKIIKKFVNNFIFTPCNYALQWYIYHVAVWCGGYPHLSVVANWQPLYFSKPLTNRPSFLRFCCIHRWNVSGEIVSTHLAGRFCACMQQVLGRTGERVFGGVRLFIWLSPSKLDFAAESCGIGKQGFIFWIPTIRTITVPAAFKILIYDINLWLFVSPVSRPVFPNSEKLSWANKARVSETLF